MSVGKSYDDPVWEYVLSAKIQPYIIDARNFWGNISDIDVKGTGVFPVKDANAGFMYRVTNTPVRSPIKGVQVFPFVPVPYLQITGVAGGASRMISRVCADNKFVFDEFTIIEKHNLPSTYHSGQFLAIIPTAVLEHRDELQGKYIYLTKEEMTSICTGTPADSLINKVIKYL